MANKYFGVTPNQPLGSPDATPTSFLWYQGYEWNDTFAHPMVVGDANAEPTLIGEDPTLLIDPSDTIIIFDYRSRASFSEAFLNAAPDTNSVTRMYQVLLNRQPDTGGLASFSDSTKFATNRASLEQSSGHLGIRMYGEYQNNQSSILSYPLYILDQDGDTFWHSDNYEAYVDHNGDLLAAYNNAVAGGETRTKNQWGRDHFQYFGRGEARLTYFFEPAATNFKFESTNPSVSDIQGLLYLPLGENQTNEYLYTVTANADNTAYLWNGHGLIDAKNPNLYFRHGDIITITNTSGGHVMEIVSDSGAATITESNGVIYVNPALQGNYTYRCTTHAVMTGSIYIGEPYINQGPEDGYGTGLLPTRNTQVGINQIRTKINEIITKGGLGGSADVTVEASSPDNPQEGDLWFDTTVSELYVYDEGVGWIQTNGAVGGANVTTSTTAPSDASEGDLWYDTSIAELYVYIDGIGWLQANPSGGGGEGYGVTAMVHASAIRSNILATTENSGIAHNNRKRLYDLNNITTANTTFMNDYGNPAAYNEIFRQGTFDTNGGPIFVQVSYAAHHESTSGGGIDQVLCYVAQHEDVNGDRTRVVIHSSNSPSADSTSLPAYINLTAVQLGTIEGTGGGGGIGGGGGGDSVDFHSGTFHGEDANAADHEIVIPVHSSGKCGGVLELSDMDSGIQNDESGMMSWSFDASTGEIRMQQSWSGGSGIYNKSASVTATLTSTYQTIDISTSYSLFDWEAKYAGGNLYLTSSIHHGVWQATTSTPGDGDTDEGTGGYDTGWVDTDGTTNVGAGATMVFKHNLGSAAEEAVFSVYAAEDANGTNMEQQNYFFYQLLDGGNYAKGIQVKSITSTTVTVQLAPGAFTATSTGGYVAKSWGTGTDQFSHIRLVMVSAAGAGGGGGGGGGSGGVASFSTGWVNQDKNGVAVNLDTRLDFDHDLGTTDFAVKVYQANDENGTDARDVSDYYWNVNNEYGARVYDITNNSLAVEFGAGGDYNLNLAEVGSDTTSSLSNNWIKVVCVTGGTSGASDNWLTVPALTDTDRFPQARLFNGVQGQNGTLIYNGAINGYDSNSGYSDLYTSMNIGDPNTWHVLRVGPGSGAEESIQFRPQEDDITAFQGHYNAGYGPQGVYVGLARTSNRGGYIFIPVNSSGTVEAFGTSNSSGDSISVEKLATFPYIYSGNLLHNGALAATAQDNSSTPGAMTTVDASGAVGSRQALMMVRVAPSSTITAGCFTRTTGDNLTGYGDDTGGGWGAGGCPVYGAGSGPAITSGAYASYGINRGAYVMVLTDTQGRFEASVSSGTGAVNLTCHSYVIPTIHNTNIFNGSLAGATSNGTYGRFSTINLSNTNTIDTGLSGVKLVYLMCYSASSADVSVAFRPKGDAVTFPKNGNDSWVNSGGCGLAVYRVSGGGVIRGGYVACLTNSSGQIEMLSNGAATNVTVVLKASVTPQNLY